MRPRAMILHGPGTNRDAEAAHAVDAAGAQAVVVPLRQLRDGAVRLEHFQMLVVPGGFSYGDALGAGRLLALDLGAFLGDALRDFTGAGKPILGVCNGFQVLVRLGMLPGGQRATLAANESGRFECRWVTLVAEPGRCVWTAELPEPIECPVAHGEGRFTASPATLTKLAGSGQIAFRYAAAGRAAGGAYPANPNGSNADIAGVCDPSGTVLGLMPHPEDNVLERQHRHRARGVRRGLATHLFENGVRHARQT